jgi:proteic killer suppression protein
MNLYFRSRKLEKTCNNEKQMKGDLGPAIAKKLRQRLQELEAADSLADISHLPPPRCHELQGDRAGELSVDLVHSYRLIFIPADDTVPVKDDGGLDWSKVTEVAIVEIVDTH